MKIALTAAYLGSILAAAWAVTHVGTQYDPHGPHVLPVWPSIEAPSGVYVVGVTLVLRDLLQKHGTYRAIAASNAVALVVDSVLFLAIAFGSLAFVEGQVIGKALSTVAAIGVLFLIGRARKVVAR